MKNQILPKDDETESEKKRKHVNLTLENYATFLHSPSNNSHLTYHHFSQILKMHGFYPPTRTQRRKTIISEAVGAIDNLMSPYRSTLTEPQISSCKSSLSIDDDLEALQWRDMSVQTFRFFAFEDNDDDDDDNNGDDFGNGGNSRLAERNCVDLVEKSKVKRGRKPKQRVLFEPVFATKPRSKKKIQKRRNIREISLSSCFCGF